MISWCGSGCSRGKMVEGYGEKWGAREGGGRGGGQTVGAKGGGRVRSHHYEELRLRGFGVSAEVPCARVPVELSAETCRARRWLLRVCQGAWRSLVGDLGVDGDRTDRGCGKGSIGQLLVLPPEQPHLLGRRPELPAVGDVKDEVHGGVDEAEDQGYGDGGVRQVAVAAHVVVTLVLEQQASGLHQDRGQTAHDEDDADSDQDLGHLALLGAGFATFLLSSWCQLLSLSLAAAQHEQNGDRAVEHDSRGQVGERHGKNQVVVQHDELSVFSCELVERDDLDGGVELRTEHLLEVEEHVGVPGQHEGHDGEKNAGDEDLLPRQQGRRLQGVDDGDVALHGDQAGVQPRRRAQVSDEYGGHELVLCLHPERRQRVEAPHDALGRGPVHEDEIEEIHHGQADQDDVGHLPGPLIQQHAHAQYVAGQSDYGNEGLQATGNDVINQ